MVAALPDKLRNAWRRIVAMTERTGEWFMENHSGTVALWILGFYGSIPLFIFAPKWTRDIGGLVVELLGEQTPMRAGALRGIGVVAVYVAFFVVVGVLGLLGRFLWYAFIAGVWIWLLSEHPTQGLIITGFGLLGFSGWWAVKQHLANQRRIIAALEKQANRRDEDEEL